MNTQPPSWPESAPAYHTHDGWLYEKKMAYNAIAYKIKDTHANRLIAHAETMCEYAISAIDEVMFWKYHIIGMRLINYRINLLSRYKPVELYGNSKV